MKQIKKLFSTVSVVLSLLLTSMLCACGVQVKETSVTLLQSDAKTIVFRAEKTDIQASVFDAMTALKEKGEIDFTYEDGDYGAYVQTVNGTTLQEKQFWGVYTSLAEYEGVSYSSAEWGTYVYGGGELFSANYGVSGLPLIEGEIYVVTVGSYA